MPQVFGAILARDFLRERRRRRRVDVDNRDARAKNSAEPAREAPAEEIPAPPVMTATLPSSEN